MVAFATVGMMPGAAAGEETVEIGNCTTISTPGNYELTQDIVNTNEDPCIEILADDVTFDGNGFTIDGVDNAGSVGILVDAPHDHKVKIKDVEVTQFGDGIRILAGKVKLKNVRAVDNLDDGIDADDAKKVKIHDSKALRNGGEGIEIDDVDHSEVEDSIADENGADGIDIERSETEVVENHVRNNDFEGVDLDGIEESLVKKNKINDNGEEGLELENSEPDVADLNDIKIKKNEIFRNGENGIDIDGVGESIDTKVVKNDVQNNDEWGIDVDQVKDLKIDENTFLNNGAGQIRVTDSIRVDIGDNEIGL